MSILNLGLQCVGLARAEMSEEFEMEVEKSKTLSDLRNNLNSKKDLVKKSLSPVKDTLNSIFTRFKLQDKNFEVYNSATEDEISTFWSSIIALDETLEEGGVYRKKNIADHVNISAFIQHCCRASHYNFSVLKCGVSQCSICKPPRLPLTVFNTLKHIPFPTPMDDGHYMPFSEALKINTTEEHYPSFRASKPQPRKKRKLAYYATVQHIKNSNLMVQCQECDMWRLVFSRYKLSLSQRLSLQSILDNYEYTRGATFSDLHLPEEFKDVDVRDHDCFDPIEKLYYSAKYTPICVHCGVEEPYTKEKEYPVCVNCSDKAVPYTKK